MKRRSTNSPFQQVRQLLKQFFTREELERKRFLHH